MLLRDHPLMSRYGVPNWPPVWTWVDGPEIDGPENKSLKGELGILKWVGLSGIEPTDVIYTLTMKRHRISGVCCSMTLRSVVT
jgi:hypothetical protein